MRVLYDYQIFSAQDYGGISRYYCELMRQYAGNAEVSFRLPLKFTNNTQISSLSNRSRSFFNGLEFRGKRRLLGAINKAGSIAALKKNDFEVFHPTYYDPYFLKYCSRPFVLTIYDLIPERFPEYSGKRGVLSKNKRTLCNKANKIIAISQSTKRDLMELFGMPEEKIEVVYLGGALPPPGPLNLNLPEKYLLYVGNRAAYKNFIFFAGAVKPLLEKYSDLSVVCAGGGAFTSDEVSFFCKLRIAERLTYMPIMDKTLAYLYNHALCFIFPSLYEGFGIPVLEAFSCSCPVVLSRTSSFLEVAGDAGLYFNPASPQELYSAVDRLIQEPGLRKEFAARGSERLEYFSWDRCAKKTAGVYRSVA